MLALLLVVIRPAGGSVDPASRQVQCLANLRQLGVAWALYAEENRGAFAMNSGDGTANWARGWLDWTTAGDNTNTAYLTEARYALLAPYVRGDATLFKCPADVYLSSAQVARGWTERVRSYSMNMYVGPSATTKPLLNPGYQVFTRFSDFRRLAPAQAMVLIEEHPDSMNDAALVPPPFSGASWVDLPASHHEGACAFSFADGHVELKRWQSARTIVPVRFNYFGVSVTPTDPDYQWMMARASERL